MNIEAKETILEMLNRYEISINTKKYQRKLSKKEISGVRKCLLTLCLFGLTILCFINTEKNVLNIPDFVGFASMSLGVWLTIDSIFEGRWKNLFYLASKYFSVFHYYYKIQRLLKLKTHKSFEFLLKKNYFEIKDWFLINNNYENLKLLIDEMKFPLHSNKKEKIIDIDGIKNLLVEGKTNLCKDFVNVDDLEKESLKEIQVDSREESIKFFNKSN